MENETCNDQNVQFDSLPSVRYASFLNSDGSVAIHAGIFPNLPPLAIIF